MSPTENTGTKSIKQIYLNQRFVKMTSKTIIGTLQFINLFKQQMLGMIFAAWYGTTKTNHNIWDS